MPICRFFQQGNCRFGANCRNEHVLNNQYNYQSRPQQNAPPNNPQNDIAVQVRSIITDMNAAEQGKQWLLSCYGPFRGKANFPTFEDHSFEEVRWMIYNAQKQGNSDAVIQLYTRMVQEAKQKFVFYQTPTRELIDTIKNIYNTADAVKNTTANFGNNNPIFNQANNTHPSNFVNTNSIFNQTNSPLVQTNRNTSIFAASNQQQSNSIFNSGINQSFTFNSQSNNAFTTATNPTNNVFTTATNQNTNVFTTVPNQSHSIFTNNQNASHPNNVFGQVNPKPESTNVFGTTNIPLTQNTNVFTSNIVPTNTPLAQNTNIFSGNQTANSPLTTNSPLTANIFGSNQLNTFHTQQNNVFAQNSTKNDNIFSNNCIIPQQNVFSSQNISDNSKQITVPFGNQQTIFANTISSLNTQLKQDKSDNSQIFSKMEDLSEADIKAFKSERFEFGCIPILPPPASLCYTSL